MYVAVANFSLQYMHDDKLDNYAVLIPLHTGYIDNVQEVSFPKGAVSGGVNSQRCLYVAIVDDYHGDYTMTFQVGTWNSPNSEDKNVVFPPPVDVTIVDDDGKNVHADSDAIYA